MNLNILLKLFFVLLSSISLMNANTETSPITDPINSKIENSYGSSTTYQVNSKETMDMIEEYAYTNGQYEKDKKLIKNFFGHQQLDSKSEYFLMKIYEKYKQRIEGDKASMLKALPIAMQLLDQKANNMNRELIIKDKEKEEGSYPIIVNEKYYIDWENKKVYKDTPEETKDINKDNLFRIHYDNVYSYVLLEWPLIKQMDKKNPKTYPIVVIIDNYYGIYFKDLEEKVNAQIKLVEEKGLQYVNPFKTQM